MSSIKARQSRSRGRRAAVVFSLFLLSPFSGTAPLSAQAARTAEAELEADRAIVRYQEAIQSTDELPIGCTGETLYDCFGGNLTCTLENVLCSAIPAGAARTVLLARLDEVATWAPESDWLAAQRVRYAIEGRELQRAWSVAESCRGTLWRCQMLRGYAQHHRRPGAGEAAFDSALANAPSDTPAWGEPSRMDPVRLMCEWTDVSRIAPGGDDVASAGDDCVSKDVELTRFWWLVDPWWSKPTNLRRSEHFARLMAARIHDEGRDGSGGHARSHQDRLMALGPPNSWRGHVEYGAQGAERITREPYTNGGYGFVPSAKVFLDPGSSSRDDWELAWGAGDERMITTRRWHPFERYQSGILRRGPESLVVVAGYLPVLEPEMADVRANLAMGRPAQLETHVSDVTIEPSGLLRGSTTVDGDGWLLSLEVEAPSWNARVRHGAPAPGLADGFGVSTPLLVDFNAMEAGLGVARALLPSTEVGRAPVGIYFEVYGLEPQESLELTVSVAPVDRPLLGRIGSFFGLGSDESYRVSWDEVIELGPDGIGMHYLSADLSGLGDGAYRLSVTVSDSGGREAGAMSRLSVRSP